MEACTMINARHAMRAFAPMPVAAETWHAIWEARTPPEGELLLGEVGLGDRVWLQTLCTPLSQIQETEPVSGDTG
jgi:hypothetical protein